MQLKLNFAGLLFVALLSNSNIAFSQILIHSWFYHDWYKL